MPPKRKTAPTAARPPKRLKFDKPVAPTCGSNSSRSKPTVASTETASDSDDSAVQAGQAEEQVFESPWDVVEGGGRQPLAVGIVAPDRLFLRFRHKESGEETSHSYTKKKEEINWKDAEHIQKINKWRRQLFSRGKGFPNKVEKNPWAPQERVYLELMYERLREAGHSSTTIQLPHESKVFEASNTHFADRDDLIDKQGQTLPTRHRRDKSALDSFVRRKTNIMNSIRDEIKDKLKYKGADAWVPDITNLEIVARMNNKPADDKLVHYPAENKEKSKKNSNFALSAKGKAKVSAQTGTETVAPANRFGKKPNASSSQDRTEAPSALAAITPQISASQDKPEESDMPPTSQPDHAAECINADPAPEVTHHSSRLTQLEPPVLTEEDAAKLRKDGWSVPDLPVSSEDALRRHRESQNTVANDSFRPESALEALEDRLGRNPIKIGSYYTRNKARRDWSSDIIREKSSTNSDDSKKAKDDPERYDNAAVLNAVLNYATIPPFGYRGDIHSLRKDARLPEFERRLAETSRLALKRIHDEHDQAFKRHQAMDKDSVGETEENREAKD